MTDTYRSTYARSTHSPNRRRLRQFRSPVLLLALIGVLAISAGINQLVKPFPVLALVTGIGVAVASLALYRWLTRVVELRSEVPELAKSGRWHLLRRGAVLGLSLFATLMVAIAILGGWEHLSWGSFGGLIGTAGMMAAVAVTEETLFRGVVFRILEERTGTTMSLALSSLLFGAIHLVNPNATLWGTLSIAMTGGTMLAAAYVVTRSLWLPIGLHFAWNFTHAGIFGVALSGSDSPPDGLLHTELSGPAALTGGVFGPEASLIALLVCLVPTVVMLRRAVRTGRIQRGRLRSAGASA